jgi:mRNA-degrading endonuclease RelE of RelBE toxin-antitoxin system
MSYRILVDPRAANRLRSFPSYVVQRVGTVLAELAELAGVAPPPSLVFARALGPAASLMRVDLEDVSLFYRVDKREQSLTVVDVEERGAATSAGRTADL